MVRVRCCNGGQRPSALRRVGLPPPSSSSSSSSWQAHERYLPSLAAEPYLLPDFAGSVVLNVTRQVLCRCLPTYPSFSLRRFFQALLWSRNAALRMVHINGTPGGLDKNIRDTYRD